MRLLLVRWHDAETKYTGWADLEEIKKHQPPVAQSVGWELHRDSVRLILVASLIDEQGSCDTTIPIGMIVEEKELPA